MKAHRRDRAAMTRFYNWFYRFYPLIERNLGPILEQALIQLDPHQTRYRHDSVLEWACGSGELGFRLLPRFRRYLGRDQSEGMLSRAQHRWMAWSGAEKTRYEVAPFEIGDMVAGSENDLAVDWVFMSFALHLFDTATQEAILSRCLAQARQGVVVIDHEQRWTPLVALAEWLEGSHYDQFLLQDFPAIAARLETEFVSYPCEGVLVMEFRKPVPSGNHRP